MLHQTLKAPRSCGGLVSSPQTPRTHPLDLDLDGGNLVLEGTLLVRLRPALLRLEGELVTLLASDAVLACEVLSRDAVGTGAESTS